MKEKENNMCGIVGYISLIESGAGTTQGEVMRDLVTANTVRGFDGTGLFTVPAAKGGSAEYMKIVDTGGNLMGSKSEWIKMCDDTRFAVGHNRAATSGDINEECTHPFVTENVIGVHNGTISGWKTMFTGVKASMDSEAVYEKLSSVGEDTDSITEVLSSISHGAYTLVWYDMRSDKLHIARNEQRPLNFALTNGAMYFASELKMLEWVLHRQKVTVYNTLSLDTYTLLSIPREGEVEIADYEPEYTTSYGNSTSSGWGNWWGGNNNTSYLGGAAYQAGRRTASMAHGITLDMQGPHILSVTAKDFGDIPEASALDAVKNDIYKGFSYLSGADLRDSNKLVSKYFDLEQAMVEHLKNSVGIEVDTTRCRAKVPMQVCYMSREYEHLFGYADVWMPGEKYSSRIPLSVRCTSKTVLDLIADEFHRKPDHAVKLSSVEITGMRAYRTGEVTYTLMPFWSSYGVDCIEMGDDLSGKDGLKVMKHYGKDHTEHLILSSPEGVDSLIESYCWHRSYAKENSNA
jgi:hypothetical protein